MEKSSSKYGYAQGHTYKCCRRFHTQISSDLAFLSDTVLTCLGAVLRQTKGPVCFLINLSNIVRTLNDKRILKFGSNDLNLEDIQGMHGKHVNDRFY
ncbi:hypothetical protein J6590_063162 [Homalodisca vitripennis]|nr:hypothetical protein J6590_063162 [Homalodisca vitripennis]